MKVEYSIRPVTRYVIGRYEEQDKVCGSSTRGEYDNPNTAYEVAYALAKADHDRLGYPPGDERIKYPDPVFSPKMGGPEAVETVIPENVRRRIAAELDRIHTAHAEHIRHNDGVAHKGLDAAQQALCWVVDPNMTGAPFDMIARDEGWVSFGQDICGLAKPKPPKEIQISTS